MNLEDFVSDSIVGIICGIKTAQEHMQQRQIRAAVDPFREVDGLAKDAAHKTEIAK